MNDLWLSGADFSSAIINRLERKGVQCVAFLFVDICIFAYLFFYLKEIEVSYIYYRNSFSLP